MCRRISRFDFGKADVDGMILQLSAGCVQRLYDAINECFELYVPKYIVKDSTVKYSWFDRELHNVDNNRTKAHKYLREFQTFHVRPMSESDQCLYDTALRRFRELRRDFKSLHRLKYAQYIVRVV
jgi:hypothetical protein